MLGKLATPHARNRAIVLAAAALGIIAAITLDPPRSGVILFLAITTLESGAFTLIYGLRSSWREVPAARAVFWVVLAYFLVAAHALTLYLSTARFWWTDEARELLYLGLALAGLNLVLTMTRLLGDRAA